jgi:hypothetical protein
VPKRVNKVPIKRQIAKMASPETDVELWESAIMRKLIKTLNIRADTSARFDWVSRSDSFGFATFLWFHKVQFISSIDRMMKAFKRHGGITLSLAKSRTYCSECTKVDESSMA